MRPQPKVKYVRSEGYLEFIREFPCIVCERSPVEAAHSGAHGLGIKTDDNRTLPICADHHRGSKGLDSIGPVNFEKLYNIDIKERVIYYMREFCIRAGLFK